MKGFFKFLLIAIVFAISLPPPKVFGKTSINEMSYSSAPQVQLKACTSLQLRIVQVEQTDRRFWANTNRTCIGFVLQHSSIPQGYFPQRFRVHEDPGLFVKTSNCSFYRTCFYQRWLNLKIAV